MQTKIIVINGNKCHYIVGGKITLAQNLATGRFSKLAPLQAIFDAMTDCQHLYASVVASTRVWVFDQTAKLHALAALQNATFCNAREVLMDKMCNAIKYVFASSDAESMYLWA